MSSETSQNPRLVIEGRFPRVARLEDEWFEDLNDPKALVDCAVNSFLKPDLVTFWQRLPDIKPRYPYYLELDAIAALPLTSYDDWWGKQISSSSRNKVRKAGKQGVVVRSAVFDDQFVSGMTGIFNEAAIRQGRPFLHYGKDHTTVKREFSRYLFREHLIGAYVGDELIGFMMIGNGGGQAVIGQIISKISHRNLAPNNAMMAETVRYCAQEGFSHVVYAYWLEGGLGEFKTSNGFERFALPRYYIPLTRIGKVGLELGLHRGIKEALPRELRDRLKKLRTDWHAKRAANRS